MYGESDGATLKKIGNKGLVLILAIGVFGILNTEMGIVGVIPYVSAEFGVSIPDAGLLVSGFALVVAIAGPIMPLLFSRFNRKKVMLLSLSVFTVCNIVSVFAPNFEVLLAARVIPAAFHPLYVSMAMAIAQRSGDTPEECARASARVFVGVSAGMVVGAPIAGILASSFAFSVAMAFFALICMAALMLTIICVPSMPVEDPLSYGKQIAILKRPIVLVSLVAAGSINAAMFGFYSFLAEYLGAAVGMGAVAVSGMLLMYGLTNIVGNMLAGRTLGTVPTITMISGPLALIVLYALLFGVGTNLLFAGIVVVVLGVVVGFANTTDQFMVSRSAPDAPDFVNGLFLTTTNLGTTIGTSLCGLFISHWGTSFSVLGTLPCLILGFAFVVVRLKCARAGTFKQNRSRQ